MKSKFYIFLLLFARMMSHALAADVIIAPMAKREVSMGKAEQLAKDLSETVGETVQNPFIPKMEDRPAEVAHAPVAVGLGDRQLVQLLVNQMDTRGVMVVRGEYRLKVGQKIVKAGDSLMLNYEGTVYEATLTSIDATKFSIRYKGEEASKLISPKSVK